jgi:hypothetical protein
MVHSHTTPLWGHEIRVLDASAKSPFPSVAYGEQYISGESQAQYERGFRRQHHKQQTPQMFLSSLAVERRATPPAVVQL